MCMYNELSNFQKAAKKIRNNFLMGNLAHGLFCETRRDLPCDCGLVELFEALEISETIDNQKKEIL